MRKLLLGVSLTLFAVAAQAEELEYVGEFRLPTGIKIDGVEIGGLSALEYDPASGTFLALSDDLAQYGPARFYEIALDLSAKGIRGVDIRRRVDLKDLEGEAYAPRSLDPEGLRLASGATLFWSHERDEAGVPFVGEMTRDGRATRRFELPEYYAPTSDGAVGTRTNLGFEALTVRDGVVVAGMENAMKQDGPEASLSEGSPARVLTFATETGAPMAEYVYVTERVPARPSPATGFHTNGLVELLARAEGGFYALERAFSAGQGNTVRIFITRFEGATNVLGTPSLLEVDYQPMPKELLFTLQAGGIADTIDNLEGMTFGPEIDGARTLVLVSDNNFNPNGQFTQFLLFKIIE
ncbi:MAG: esterase-like activity of phytase family protein [Neomegalonema sp.]